MSPRILIIDDSLSIRTFLRLVLEGSGYYVLEASDATGGLRQLREHSPRCIILDLGLPDRDGLELLPDITTERPDAQVIILSVRNDSETRKAAFSAGATAYLTKPFQNEELLETLEEVCGTE